LKTFFEDDSPHDSDVFNASQMLSTIKTMASNPFDCSQPISIPKFPIFFSVPHQNSLIAQFKTATPPNSTPLIVLSTHLSAFCNSYQDFLSPTVSSSSKTLRVGFALALFK
jgi:hypothetical protein